MVVALVNWNRQSVLAPFLARCRTLAATPLVLFDIGVSRGIDRLWSTFGDDLRVWGFDPLVREIERLTGLGLPHHTYEAAFVGFPPYRARRSAGAGGPAETRHDQSYLRTSAVWALEVLNMDWTRETDNSGAEVVLTDRVVAIDRYCAEAGIKTIDYLKIDTDGSDYEVLLGAERMLTDGILGVQVEVQFHGAVDREANLFSTIDLFLRERGFSLFDLDLWRYSRAALPRPFVYDNIPAQTRRGQLAWGEALYLRDLGDPDHERKWPEVAVQAATPGQILKLAALFDLFNLQDCAVELLLKYRDAIDASGLAVAGELIAALIPPVAGQPVSHAQFLEHCKKLVQERRFKDIPM
jgi:FkbM family methyltransferase